MRWFSVGVRIVILCTMAALATSWPAFSQTPAHAASPPLKKPNQVTNDTLRKRLPELMKEATVPGVSLVVIRDGKTFASLQFGVRDTKTGQAVSAETIFEAASLSKPVFAYGVLKLVEAGKLDLDKPLSSYLPTPYIAGDPRLEKITARYVLSHRTGFPNWRGDGRPLTIFFTPGERFSYSGEGFIYLQKVVEKLTGKPLNDYMTEAVFAPFGMTSSSYVWRDDYDARTSTGHDAGGSPGEKLKPKEANAAASLHTTAADYAVFLDALLNRRGLKHGTIREMEKPQIAVDPECTNCTDRVPKELSKSVFWGLGVGIQESSEGESVWHWGDNGNFKCFMVAYPKQKLGLVMFTNGDNGLSIAKEVVHLALGGEQPAFQWIKYDAYDSPANQFAKAARERGPHAAIAEFRPALMRGDIPEGSINSLGYHFLGQKNLPDAILIFQLNVELYPKSGNVYDSLGEAYMNAGSKDLAIQNYERSLELDPHNSNAADMLKKLKEN
jgi:CubicO group peptidase (beta-lactamase class C family)